jgi:hypothetical protein
LSAGDVVVDDHLLLRLLLDDEPPDLRRRGGRVFTTGLWYHRLCRAVANTTVTGAMSRSLGGVGPGLAAAAVSAITALPHTIGLTSLRSLAWPMATLVADGARLNLMALEALAAAQHLDAELCLAETDDNPPLRQAARQRHMPLRLITP